MSALDIMTDTASNLVEPNLRASERFCAVDADIAFQSDDGVLFHIHRRNLEAHAEGFPPAGFDAQNDVVALSETSATLELLFQFVYPARHPYLDTVSFETLALLAEAAEKYQVFSAMNICRVRMTHTLPEQPEEIMAYAVKHDYPEIMGRAAPLLLYKSLEEIIVKLPPNLVIPWMRYHGKWIECAQTAALHHRAVYEQGRTTSQYHHYHGTLLNANVCSSCSKSAESLISQVLRELIKGTVSLKNLDNTFNSSFLCCEHMRPALVAWRSLVEADVGSIPNFTTFL